MWSSAVKFLLPSKWTLAAALALLLALGAALYVQGLRLSAAKADAARQVQAEQAAHAATRSALAEATADVARLLAALDAAQRSTGAVQESLRDALAREADAVSAAAARKQILDQMRTRVWTEAEKLEVVDDATRDAVAARLNRPL